MRLYIAGPMQGYPYFNFPLFDTAAKSLREQGYEVVNPAEHDRAKYPDLVTWPGFATGDTTLCPQFDLASCLKWDFQSLMECDGIVMLPRWENSSGAKDERRIAERTGRKLYIAVFPSEYRVQLLHSEVCMETPVVRDVFTARGGY